MIKNVFSMKLNILVTGGAGYIGSVAISKLLENGHKVHVIDNFMHNQSSLNHYCLNKNFQVNKGDIRSKEIISPLLKKADLIIPLAALVGAPICQQDPIGAATTNFDAMVMILKEISKNCTTLVIAHRLSTIKNANKIIVLGNHRVSEQGKHEELIRNNNFYKQLWDIQTGNN